MFTFGGKEGRRRPTGQTSVDPIDPPFISTFTPTPLLSHLPALASPPHPFVLSFTLSFPLLTCTLNRSTRSGMATPRPPIELWWEKPRRFNGRPEWKRHVIYNIGSIKQMNMNMNKR